VTFDLELLDSLANEGWLRRARHPDADLYLYNYTERCQFERHWTPETLACRGLIVDHDGQVVARPFGKFFNLGEPGAPEPPAGEPFEVTPKVDGSLGIAYRLDGEWRLATRGSFTSEQAQVGTAMLADYDLDAPDEATPLFEIVYPENRIVVDYGETRELVLLASIDKETGRDRDLLPYWTGQQVDPLGLDTIRPEALHKLSTPNAEGYVVRYLHSHLRFKVKFEEYVRLHRIVTGVNRRHVWDALRAGQDPLAELDGIPDEVYAWVQDAAIDLRVQHDVAERRLRIIFTLRPATSDRGDTARYFQRAIRDRASEGIELPLPALFQMLDGKPYDETIWRSIRPGPETPRELVG
jgi:RNA ligase